MRRNLKTVSTRCQRIAELANQFPQMGFTSLNHHIDLHWLPVATIRSATGALCARTAGRGPLGVPSRSEPVT